MFPWADLLVDGWSPSENFITTYQSDFRLMKDRQPPRTRPEVGLAPGFSGSYQAECETRPVFFQHFYRTSGGGGSAVGSQHPSALPSFGSSAPSSEAAGGVGSTLTEASPQKVGVAKETGLAFDARNIVSMLQQPEDGVQYQEGVILLSQNPGLFSCDEVLRVLGNEAGPQFLLSLPVVSGPSLRPDAEDWQNHLRRGWSPVRTFSLWEWTPERPAGHFETQDVPPHGGRISRPAVCGQQRLSRARPDRKYPLTEYQARFSAQWVQPPCNMNLYPSN